MTKLNFFQDFSLSLTLDNQLMKLPNYCIIVLSIDVDSAFAKILYPFQRKQ